MATKMEKLLQQQEKIKLQISKEKNKAASQKRKEDTRRKILIGAVVMSEMKKDNQLDERVKNLLSHNLNRDDDRALFDLEPKLQAEKQQ